MNVLGIRVENKTNDVVMLSSRMQVFHSTGPTKVNISMATQTDDQYCTIPSTFRKKHIDMPHNIHNIMDIQKQLN